MLMSKEALSSCAKKLADLRNRMQLTEAERAELDDVIEAINSAVKKPPRCQQEAYALVARIAFWELWRAFRESLD